MANNPTNKPTQRFPGHIPTTAGQRPALPPSSTPAAPVMEYAPDEAPSHYVNHFEFVLGPTEVIISVGQMIPGKQKANLLTRLTFSTMLFPQFVAQCALTNNVLQEIYPNGFPVARNVSPEEMTEIMGRVQRNFQAEIDRQQNEKIRESATETDSK